MRRIICLSVLALLTISVAEAAKKETKREDPYYHDDFPVAKRVLELNTSYRFFGAIHDDIVADDGMVWKKKDLFSLPPIIPDDEDPNTIKGYHRSFTTFNGKYGLLDNLALSIGVRYLSYDLQGNSDANAKFDAKKAQYLESARLRLGYSFIFDTRQFLTLAAQWRHALHQTPAEYTINTLADEKPGKGLWASYGVQNKTSTFLLSLGYVKPDKFKPELSYELMGDLHAKYFSYFFGLRGKVATAAVQTRRSRPADNPSNTSFKSAKKKVERHEIFYGMGFGGNQFFLNLEAAYSLLRPEGAGWQAMAQLGYRFKSVGPTAIPSASNNDYYLTGKIVIVKNDQKAVVINRGDEDGVMMGSNVDIFTKESSTEAVASGFIEMITENQAEIKILKVYKKVPLKAGMMVKLR